INTHNEPSIQQKIKQIQTFNHAKNSPHQQITHPPSNQNLHNPLNIPITNITKIHTNFTKNQQPTHQLNQNFQQKQPQLNSTPHPTQDQKQHPLTTLTQVEGI
ncbi:hypothetical protein, partial [Staphylococcus epidermidis]|uniref:hypothetical protein n=1 Tax=Staphylococcus epidermidis TaxID=1282 RepID=UPI001C930A3A